MTDHLDEAAAGQLAFALDAAQTARNAACAPPAAPGDRTHQDGPCVRCAALSASPTAPATGARCVGCRFAADHAERRCAVCGGPIDPGRKNTTRYCSRRCKDRGNEARAAERDYAAAERDYAAGVPHDRPRCRCARPVGAVDDLGETRCVLCGRTPAAPIHRHETGALTA